ncbi:tRNA-specific 2-thiouridylase MnmA [Poriferisphaera corsica]|uniref:tRNA-specific 2-thiouridylase MnmA n=1 Tax=Poriferisphaera corsica TaxID=2528020 RepID=A0A517YQN3_9BACT|nr:tRNA 2-thiouridine(34) synthase MnmA [Poriferisphaera corsica]QDU32536.1 tRNA-specific 2-thiouridylase MnmA [Poriferisphaera corsica]
MGNKTSNSNKKVLVAMSGGVDSSVVAALLKSEGYDVVGCFMRLGSDDSAEAADGYDNLTDASCDPKKIKLGHQGCCSLNDASDARLVAAMLDIPFYVLNFKQDFGRVIDYFVSEYNAGRTPNPCVRCNDWLKFGKLHAYAKSIDAHYIASGHYARISPPTTSSPYPKLLRGLDHNKDQSYVLFGSGREQLSQMLLPIGELEKPAVRQIADDYNLPVFNKPDSQEICFVPDNEYANLVKRRTPEQFSEGNIVDTQGNIVGTHEGHQHFTIGQRRGLGVALGYPIYVTHRDPQGNTITVGQKPDLLAQALQADQVNWLSSSEDAASLTDENGWITCEAKIRYNSPPKPAQCKLIEQDGNQILEVKFHDPQEAITPGQAVVCYSNDLVLGGGWITKAID